MALRVAMYLKDNAYLDRLVEYISSEYSNRIRLFVFTDKEEFIKQATEIPIDAIVADSEFEFNVFEGIRNSSFCCLTEHYESSINDSGMKVRHIFKYQKASNICKDILSALPGADSTVFQRNESGTDITAFCSVKGGAGATTLSAAYAIYLTRQGNKVLLLNLVTFDDSRRFIDSKQNNHQGFEDLILCIKTAKASIISKLESVMSRSETTGVYYINPCENPCDMADINDNDIGRLFAALKESSFNNVIVDFDMVLDDFSFSVMEESDKVILISDGTIQSTDNCERVIKSISFKDIRNKTRFMDKLLIIGNKLKKDEYFKDCFDTVKTVGRINNISKESEGQIALSIAANDSYFRTIP